MFSSVCLQHVVMSLTPSERNRISQGRISKYPPALPGDTYLAIHISGKNRRSAQGLLLLNYDVINGNFCCVPAVR